MSKNTSRRDFLKLAGAVGVNSMIAPLSINLAAMSKAAAENATDYKALVGIFLYGGNDHNNTVIPADKANYNAYKNIRPDIAISQEAINATKLNILNSLPSNMLELALHPKMGKMKALFEQQKLALLFNVGPLYTPTTIEQYNKKSVPLPPNLFSHNDQQSIWQSFQPEGAKQGWGGKALDVIMDGGNTSLFTSITTSSNHVFLSGNSNRPYRLSGDQGIPIYGAREGDELYKSKLCSQIFRQLLTENNENIIANEYSKIIARSMDAESIIRNGFSNIDENLLDSLDSYFPNEDSLSVQLKSVAKLIAIRDQLDFPLKRQVFMVSLPGFDHHDNLLGRHDVLLQQLSEAMNGFYKATEALKMSNSVTTFTASDFGRTFTSNGDGSDHGWGSHHFIMGGAVNGGKTYGELPEYALKTNLDVGQGRLLPTTSVSSYMATLAQWFGVSEGDLEYISPYINNFDNKNIGFMQNI